MTFSIWPKNHPYNNLEKQKQTNKQKTAKQKQNKQTTKKNNRKNKTKQNFFFHLVENSPIHLQMLYHH